MTDNLSTRIARNNQLRHRTYAAGLTGPAPSGAFLFALDKLIATETDRQNEIIRHLKDAIQAAADHLKRGDEYDRDVADSLMEVLSDAA